jgi:prepilin-type N-terminal cleavage/methylation domain-containing protein
MFLCLKQYFSNGEHLMSTSKQSGFTLIEIVIVMAIAALMILVVFQGVTGAQKSQRDSTRKQEVGRIQSMLETYSSNNNGVYPAGNAVGVNGAALTNLESNAAAPLASGASAKYANAACPTPVAPSTYNLIYTPAANNRSYTLSVCLEGVQGAQQIAP